MRTGKKAIVWFRNDLRLHDNEALTDALLHAEFVIPVFVFDEREFLGNTRFGFRKTGKFRTQFYIESLQCLRKKLIDHGSDLIVRIGKPEEVIMEIAQEEKISWVYCNRERTSEEVYVQDTLEENLWSIGREVRYSRGKMLYYTSDLPFPVTHTPDLFSSFRKEVEKFTPIREPLKIPEIQGSFNCNLDSGEIPSLTDLNHENYKVSPENDYLRGGEDEAMKALEYYFSGSQRASSYLDQHNYSYGRDSSTKLSVYLSSGCLSPKYLYARIKEYETEFKANKSTYSIFLDLLWRDFFRLTGKKYKEKIFLRGGIRSDDKFSKQYDVEILNRWCKGLTGFPYVDAHMRQLNSMGFMSNRGRQNVASFLVNDLQLNWQLGASYFESQLIDYDPCSNYCNWNYIAGIGNDYRDHRKFNVLLESKKWDPDAKFIRQWIPELGELDNKSIHTPFALSESELLTAGVVLGEHYPRPIIDTLNQETSVA